MAKLAFILVCCLLGAIATPLDDYVNAPDPSYKYTLAGTLTGNGPYPYTAFFINLTSQTWMTYEQSNKPVWTHWLTICVPPKVEWETAFLFIDGDKNSNNPPSEVDDLVAPICGRYNSIIAVLNQIPDEPITFVPETQGRTEDALIAFTWAKFLNDTSDPTWLARLPMTKAVVRAMDTVTDFLGTFANIPPQKNFVIGGASKRGWTTWTTAAVDKRVIAAVPIVMPILNMVPNLNHHYQAYGGWSFALQDYENMNIMGYLNSPEFLAMGAIIDPYSYLSRLTMPLYIICATGDEFFLPDSPRFFTDALEGEYHLRMVPNAEHSLAGHGYDVISSIGNFYYSVLLNEVRPKYSYNMVYSNDTASITVKLLDDNVPAIVKLWTSNTLSFIQRDFRLVICDDIEHCLEPVLWWETTIEGQNGVYEASIKAPAQGWTGFMIELTYVVNGNNMVFTSEVNIVPDRMPFPPCGDHCQPKH